MLAFATAVAGCGKTAPSSSPSESSAAISALGSQGAVGVATKNTTRLGGADPASDAAAVARAAYPGLTPTTRPQAVVLVDEHDLAGRARRLGARRRAAERTAALHRRHDSIPDVTAAALRAMRPVGAAALGGAQVIRVGTTAAVPEGLRTRTVSAAGGGRGDRRGGRAPARPSSAAALPTR